MFRPLQRMALCGLGLGLALQPAALLAHTETLFELSLDALLQIEVETATRMPQPVVKTPAAVHVIRQSDIRRAGASSLMEALRLAPGVHVARLHSSAYAISIRGMSTKYANKLLVLVDGRSVYTPVFAGVIWRLQDLPVEEINRIEVIRGPGSSTWGANAVNGIINIVTRAAGSDHGPVTRFAAGTDVPADVYGSTNGTLDNGTAYRFYAGHKRVEAARRPDGTSNRDDWHLQQVGWRTDTLLDSGAALEVQGRLMSGRTNESIRAVSVIGGVPVESTVRDQNGLVSDSYLRLSYALPLAEDETVTATTYASSLRDAGATSDLDLRQRTLHGEVTHALPVGASNRMIWGGSVTHTRLRLRGKPAFYALPAAQYSLNYYQLFAQGEYTALDGALQVTTGLKLEHRPFVGADWLPSLRALWAPDDQQVLWGAISRAARTPSIAGRKLSYFNAAVAAGPTLVQARSDDRVREVESEVALTTELGYRFRLDERVSADLALFYTDYENYTSAEPGALECGPSGNLVNFGGPTGAGSVAGCAAAGDTYYVQPVLSDNQLAASTWGGETSLNWEPRPDLRLSLHYSHYRESFRPEPGGSGIPAGSEQGTTPRHMAGLRASFDHDERTHLDAWLRHVGKLDDIGVNRYTELDLRIARTLSEDCEISLSGRNLLDSQHAEFSQPVSGSPPTEVERSVSLGLRWTF